MNNQSTVAMHIALARREHLEKQATAGSAARTGGALSSLRSWWGARQAARAANPSAGAGGHLGSVGLLGLAGTSSLAGKGLDLTKEQLGWIIPAIFAAPPLAALTTAALVSTATSPPLLEAQTAQGEIEEGELDEALSSVRRRKAHRERNIGAADAERSLYIG